MDGRGQGRDGLTGALMTSSSRGKVSGIPLHMLQKWMGHAQLSPTAIYADAVGKEEQDIAARMWG